MTTTLLWILAFVSHSHNAIGGEVIDLGQLEIEGELRRPIVEWIDSQKRLKGMLPSFYERQFSELEQELLRPGTRTLDEVKNHVNR